MRSDTYLSYELLEDVMFLPLGNYKSIVERAMILRIGPLVEYAYHHYQDLPGCFQSRLDNPAVNLVVKALEKRATLNTSSTAQSVEFAKAPQTAEEVENPNWILFCLRFVDAGIKAGLSKSFAQALVSTLEEMCGNRARLSTDDEAESCSLGTGRGWRAGGSLKNQVCHYKTSKRNLDRFL